MKQRRALIMAGYAAFACVALLFSLYLTLPADALAQRLGHEMQRASHGAWTFTYAEASPWRLSGVALRGVALHRNAPGTEPLNIPVDELRARLRLFPLLLGRLSLGTDIRVGHGRLLARVTPRSHDALDVDVTFDKVDLASPPLLGKLLGIGLTGTLDGRAIVSWQHLLNAARGDVDLALAQGSVGPGTIAGMSLPRIDLGALTLTGELRDGRAKIGQFHQKGGNVSLRLKGSANLREPLNTSTLDGCAQIRADPAFLAQNPTMKSLLSLAEVRLKRDGEGYLHVPVAGPVRGVQVIGGLCR